MRLNPGSTDQTETGEVEVFVKPSQVEKPISCPYGFIWSFDSRLR